jgi:hypothetical protein
VLTGPAAQRLTRTFQARIALIGDRAARVAAARWLGLPGYDEEDVARFETSTRAVLQAAHAAAVHSGVGYYATLGQFRPPSVAAREVPYVVDPREPFVAYWNALDKGHPWEEAVRSGSARAEALARDLATSSSRKAGDVTMKKANQRVEGWSRSATAGACPWCKGLEQYVWETAEATDFGHTRCHCTPVPMVSVGSLTVAPSDLVAA